MHELGITQRILEVALDRAAMARATRITDIHVELGEESDVAPESVGFYWPQVSRGTAAEAAHLRFTTGGELFGCRVVSIDVEDGR